MRYELKEIVKWAAYGMSLPNLLRYGSEVKYRRWHGNYIRCMVKMGEFIHKGYAPRFFIPGRIVAVAEFVGNTLSRERCLILFSEFEAIDWAVWGDGTHVYKCKGDVKYSAYVELKRDNLQIFSQMFEISQSEVFELAETALDNVEGKVKSQLRIFFENYYFLPRDRDRYKHYVDIDKYDCIWTEEFLEDRK